MEEPRDEAEFQGDKRKSVLASGLFFLLFVSVLAVSTIIGQYPDSADLRSPSTVRRAVANWYSNQTVDPCVDFYNFSCQRYTNAAPPYLSVLGQAQLSVIDKRSVIPEINLSTVGDPIAAGIFPFYAAETRYRTVYLYPIDENPESTLRQRSRRTYEQLSYQQVRHIVVPQSHWSALLNRTAEVINTWLSTVEVLLVNDQKRTGEIVEPWFVEMSHANAQSNLSQRATACVEAQVAQLQMSSVFATPTRLLDNAEVEGIVGEVVDALRPLNLVFGGVGLAAGGPEPPCIGRSVSQCLQFLWNDQLSLLQRNQSTFAPWPFSRLETNAVYNHIDNTVYIPAGLLSWPFFDPAWSWRLTLSSLGWIIAHEFSHALPISDAQATCMDTVESALSLGRGGVSAAMHRANMTLNENYADHMALHYITKLLQMDDQRPVAMKESFLVWAQTWCGGNPRYWYPNDTHQSPALRVNATLEMSFAFTNAFKCPQRYPPCTM